MINSFICSDNQTYYAHFRVILFWVSRIGLHAVILKNTYFSSNCPVLQLCLNSSVLSPVSLSPRPTFSFLFPHAASCVALSLSTLASSSPSSSSVFIQAPSWWSTGPRDHPPLPAPAASHIEGYGSSYPGLHWTIALLCFTLLTFLHFCDIWHLFMLTFFCFTANYLVWPRPLPGHHLIWFALKNQETLEERTRMVFFNRLSSLFWCHAIETLTQSFLYSDLNSNLVKLLQSTYKWKARIFPKKQSAINPSAFIFFSKCLSLPVSRCNDKLLYLGWAHFLLDRYNFTDLSVPNSHLIKPYIISIGYKVSDEPSFDRKNLKTLPKCVSVGSFQFNMCFRPINFTFLYTVLITLAAARLEAFI